MPKCDFNKAAYQRYWNHTSAEGCRSVVFIVNFEQISHLLLVSKTYHGNSIPANNNPSLAIKTIQQGPHAEVRFQ